MASYEALRRRAFAFVCPKDAPIFWLAIEAEGRVVEVNNDKSFARTGLQFASAKEVWPGVKALPRYAGAVKYGTVRATADYWDLEGDYGQGWEVLCAGETLKEVRDNQRDYRDNDGVPTRIVKRREKLF